MEDSRGTVLLDPRLPREADGGRRGPAVLQNTQISTRAAAHFLLWLRDGCRGDMG